MPSVLESDSVSPELGPQAPGLVPTKTSGTQGVDPYLQEAWDEYQATAEKPLAVFHPNEARLKKLKRAVMTAARLHQDTAAGPCRLRPAMITTTYREDVDYSPRHISEMLARIRKYMARRGQTLRYCWVAELTKRGRVHYHVVIWLPWGSIIPKPDLRGWWPHGHTRIETVKRAVGYVAKYASKAGWAASGEMPKGARLHGTGGLDDRQRRERRWWMAPQWLRELTTESMDVHRALGGGWLSRRTGEHFSSPFRIVWQYGHIYVFNLEQGAIP